jgi:hypothetical protein
MPATRTLLVLASTAVALTASYLALAQSVAPRDFKSSVQAQHATLQPGSTVRMNRLIVKFRGDGGDKFSAQAGASAREHVHALNARLD